MDKNEQSEAWLKLPPKVRKRKVMQAYVYMRPKIQERLKLIKEKEQDGSPKDIRHLFLLTTFKAFWEDLDFLFNFGRKSAWQEKAHYPARSALDKVAKVAYFTRQKKERQKELARFEAYRTMKSLYDMATKNEDTEFQNKILAIFKEWHEKGDPELHQPRRAFQGREFPNTKQCMEQGGIPNADALYTQFEALSQLDHGNFLTDIMRKEDTTLFARSAQLGLHLANEILQGIDFHFFEKKIRQETLDVGAECRRILAEGQ